MKIRDIGHWWDGKSSPIIRSGGVPIAPGTLGDVYFVDSGHSAASDTDNSGKDRDKPLATIDAAVGKCSANNGDVIIVAEGHSESITAAAGIAFDVAGIRVIGMGHGAARPTITFSSAITADIDIDAASVVLENLLFVNGIDNLTAPIDVNAADFTMINCETRDNNSSYHCDDFIVSDANADRMTILGWVHRANGGKVGAQTAISIVGGSDHLIMPALIDGNFATACIENVTTACDSLSVMGSAAMPCYLRTRNAADILVKCVATTKGHIGPFLYGRLNDDAANITEALVGASMEFFPPLYLCNGDGEKAIETNITASADA